MKDSAPTNDEEDVLNVESSAGSWLPLPHEASGLFGYRQRSVVDEGSEKVRSCQEDARVGCADDLSGESLL